MQHSCGWCNSALRAAEMGLLPGVLLTPPKTLQLVPASLGLPGGSPLPCPGPAGANVAAPPPGGRPSRWRHRRRRSPPAADGAGLVAAAAPGRIGKKHVQDELHPVNRLHRSGRFLYFWLYPEVLPLREQPFLVQDQ
ncbi:hypothetical protein AV530_013436 [Patagioenas fasciata monilis]|uniref:Uncharacterized protein n=1 Tax=Patagioenas fasciata monilis TaxID=372326 RepID=A0A1V4JQP3_PATFA|nr:hypothetical protein AV530_013436 [Patagioenas fasciata monilis]